MWWLVAVVLWFETAALLCLLIGPAIGLADELAAPAVVGEPVAAPRLDIRL